MPEALQASFNVDVYLTWLLPLILTEEGGTRGEIQCTTIYTTKIPIAHPQAVI